MVITLDARSVSIHFLMQKLQHCFTIFLYNYFRAYN